MIRECTLSNGNTLGAGQNVYNQISPAWIEQVEGSDHRETTRYVSTL